MVFARQEQRPYTAEDLAGVPDDGRRFEVLGGELIVSPSPTVRHQRISREIVRILQSHLDLTEGGEVFSAPLDVFLGEHDVVQPDVLIVLRSNDSIVRLNAIHGAPDLVVEIVSPSSAGIDRVRKSATYAMHGVLEYWIVDPETEIILAQELIKGRYRPIVSEDEMCRSKVIADLVVEPKTLFATPEWLAKGTES
jgi:Uma2 family endonuclease